MIGTYFESKVMGLWDPESASWRIRDDNMFWWFRGKEVAIRKLLFLFEISHRIATSFPHVTHQDSVILSVSEGSPGFRRNLSLNLVYKIVWGLKMTNTCHSERSDEPSPALRDELTEGNLLLLVVKYI